MKTLLPPAINVLREAGVLLIRTFFLHSELPFEGSVKRPSR